MKNTERDLAFYVVDIFEDLLDDRFVPKMKSSNDEQLITVVCSSCGSHFEAPTEWWVRKRSQYTNIPDGVMTTCPHCGNVTIVREMKPNE